MSALADAPVRRRIRDDLAATLFVEAAAGTGKTTEMIARIIEVVRTGTGTLDRIVGVTFTEKAAGEMKLRLREEIEKARLGGVDAVERARFDLALEHLEVARIGTIHAFCAELLRERPVEAGVDPLFEVCAEDDSEALLNRAFDTWFERTLADPPQGVRRILRRRPRSFGADTPRTQLRNALRSLVAHRDFPAPWRKSRLECESDIDNLMTELAELAGLAVLARYPDDWLGKNLQELKQFVDENRLREQVRGRDYDALEAELRELAHSRQVHWHWRGSPRSPYAPDLPRERVIAQRARFKSSLDTFLEAADSHLAACLHEALMPAVKAYERFKRRAGKLDFLDLLLEARALIRDDASVRATLQARFSHFFVDEFQDTDPLQAEMLVLLSADDPGTDDWQAVTPVPGKLFLVGDPKQSIYRFRRADVAVYEHTKRCLTARGAEVLHLSSSFRSLPALQAAVNAAFEPWMPGKSAAQARYVSLQPVREGCTGQPAVVALPVPRPYGDYGKIVKWKIDESLPDAVGAFIDWLVRGSGWTVSERGGAENRVAIAPRHICILFRRFKHFRDDVTRPYARALEARRIAHVLVGGHSFHEREEVLAVRNALCAIEWPDDELRVFATLRGPFFGLGDDALLAYRHRFGSLHPMREQDAGSLDALESEVGEALALLARLHLARNRRSAADTLSELLEAVRAHAGIAIWPTGDQALANCLHVIELARRFERGGAPSFRALVEKMESDAEQGTARDAPPMEEGTEGVRIMTVHKAKGLEFPVVVLADPTCRATRDKPSRHVDTERRLWAETICDCAPRELLDAAPAELERDRDEAVRLAYVAATRARDLLVVPVVGDYTVAAGDKIEGWLDVLNPVVYPPQATRRAARPAPGCPGFGMDSVLSRPPKAAAGVWDAVAPGLHIPQAGQHQVVWWDPRVLELDKQAALGLRQARVLEADASGVAADAGVTAHARWRSRRAQTLDEAGRPCLTVATVTALSEAGEVTADAAGRDISLEEARSARGDRPHGKRFGTLVHATLATIELDAGVAEVAAAARMHGRLLGASPAEVAGAAAAVSAAMQHPVLRRAAACAAEGGLHRETPLVQRLADGSLAEGVIDLAFRERDGEGWRWVVVDFKTDVDIAARRAHYESQVRLYVQGLSKATGEPAEGIVLLV